MHLTKENSEQPSMFQCSLHSWFFPPILGTYRIFIIVVDHFSPSLFKININQQPAAKFPVGGLHYTKHDDLTEFIHRIGCNCSFLSTQFTTLIVHELEWIIISTSIVIKVKIWTSVWCCSSNKSTLNHNYSFRFCFLPKAKPPTIIIIIIIISTYDFVVHLVNRVCHLFSFLFHSYRYQYSRRSFWVLSIVLKMNSHSCFSFSELLNMNLFWYMVYRDDAACG